MKEGTETQCYYLDVRIKMGVTCKYLAPNLYRKFKKSFKRNSFWEKRLSLSQFLIFLVPLFGKQSHFDINNDFFYKKWGSKAVIGSFFLCHIFQGCFGGTP